MYTGHRDINEDGEEHGNDKSFEGALPEGHLGDINFSDGTKVKVCVSFENSVHPISHVCMFMRECNAPGWVVTFGREDYTNATIICDMEASWNEVFYYCKDKIEEVSDVLYEKVHD